VWVTEQRRADGLRTPAGESAEYQGYPGQDLGLPETGQRSVSRWGRRIGALCVDWLLCSLIVIFLVRPPGVDRTYWTLAIFAAQDVILTAVTGLTVGKLAFRIRVVRLDGRPVGLIWAFVRTLMLLLVAPPLIADKDMRGLHDRASNTIVVRI